MNAIEKPFVEFSKEFIAGHEKHGWDDFKQHMVFSEPKLEDDLVFKAIYMIELCKYDLELKKTRGSS